MFDLSFFTSSQEFLIIAMIICISQFIYAALGFGSGMFAISVLSLLYGKIDFFVPYFVLMCLPTETFITWKERKLMKPGKVRSLIVAVTLPLIAGSWLLKRAHGSLLYYCLGAIVILLSLYHLFWEKKFKPSLTSPLWVPGIGLFSGLLGGLFGMSGPPLIFYFKAAGFKKREFRAALLTIFFFMSVIRLISYLFLGLFTVPLLLSVLMTYPFALAGLWAGSFAHERINEQVFKVATSLVLLTSGILIILKNI